MSSKHGPPRLAQDVSPQHGKRTASSCQFVVPVTDAGKVCTHRNSSSLSQTLKLTCLGIDSCVHLGRTLPLRSTIPVTTKSVSKLTSKRQVGLWAQQWANGSVVWFSSLSEIYAGNTCSFSKVSLPIGPTLRRAASRTLLSIARGCPHRLGCGVLFCLDFIRAVLLLLLLYSVYIYTYYILFYYIFFIILWIIYYV